MDILSSIATTSGLPELWRVVRRFVRQSGFSAAAIFVPRSMGTPVPGGEMDVRGVGFSSEIVSAYRQSDGHFDPVPRYALELGMPLRWSEAWESQQLTPAQEKFRQVMRDVGIGDGFTFPVFGPNGRNAAIAIGNPISPDVLENAPVETLHIVLQAAYTKSCWLTASWQARLNPLSNREVEILELVARGKSNSVIADILSLSSNTVDTYLRRIYDKLDVSDRTSAAVRGVGMGLISAA